MERKLCHYSSNKSSVLQINTICFAKKTRLSNKRKLICKYKTLFERKCRDMDKYVLCVKTVRLICLFMTKGDLIFSQMRAGRFLTCVQQIFSQMACRQIFSHVFKLIFSQMQSKQRWRCWSIYAKHRFTFSRNTADQHEWGTGEFLSYYFYN